MGSKLMAVVTTSSLLFLSCGGDRKSEEIKPPQLVAETTKTPESPDTLSETISGSEKPIEPKEDVKESAVPKEVTLHGELVDLVSYISSGAMNDPEAIRKSAKVGNPIGFFDTSAKKIYIVGLPQINTGANERLLPYVGIRVFLIGKTYRKSGVDVILVSDIGKSIK